MKKAEDFCLEMGWTYDSDPGRFNLFKGLIEPIVKKAQEDAIREAVICCSQEAKAETYAVRKSFSFGQGIRVDRGSILSVADKLIKEL